MFPSLYIHTHIYTWIHTYTHTLTTYIHTHIYTYIHTHIDWQMCGLHYTMDQIQGLESSQHIYIHLYTLTYTHTKAHIHTQTHTQSGKCVVYTIQWNKLGGHTYIHKYT